MNTLPENYWSTRLQARIHDPAGKALVLMRLPGGHESGSVAAMKELFADGGLAQPDLKMVKRADHWASAADRLPWPKEFEQRYADSVHFYKQPELRHPLSGASYDLQYLEVSAAELSAHEAQSLPGLIIRTDDGSIDPRLTALAMWRFAPELAPEGLGHLWRLLPADTRIPDHSIWQHLDLTSALAGAMVADEQAAPALLTVSIGPVQDFIAQARKTDDLWAGSHLLAQLAFEAIRVIAELLGPEQLIFPALRGVPVVDQWVAEQLGQSEFDAKETVFKTLATYPHQQQVAALPNRLLAIVPMDRAEDIARLIENRLQQWLADVGKHAIDNLVDDAAVDNPEQEAHLNDQMQRHLHGLLDLHWAAVPWTLAGEGTDLDTERLATALGHFYPPDDATSGFMQTPLMRGLSQHAGIDKEPQYFWRPNPGIAYSALHDMANRALAAAKYSRTDKQTDERGFRCSLCGDREILVLDPQHRFTVRGRRPQENGLWHRLGKQLKSAANVERNEALCGVCTVKRLWPTLWRERLNEQGHDTSHSRVVSTHVMAATPRLKNLVGLPPGDDDEHYAGRRVALPLALYQACKKNNQTDRILYDIEASEDPEHDDHDTQIDSGLYYGILLFDGDKLGAWLSGDTHLHASLVSLFHSKIANAATSMAKKSSNKLLNTLLQSARTATPSMHASLSATLNDFAVGVVPELINQHYYGQLIYAGGDDVLAMLPHDQLLQAALAVRQCWSGVYEPGEAFDLPSERGNSVRPSRGYVVMERRNRLLRAMGEAATGSAGLVLVPAKMPLGRALQSVRAAEKAAKNSGRDAFSISVVKRSGGTLQWQGHWPVPRDTDASGGSKGAERALQRNDMLVLIELIDKLADPRVSPRFSFQMQAWARELEQPWHNASGAIAPEFIKMLETSLVWQLDRQGLPKARQADLGARIAAMVCAQPQPLESLRHLLGIAEFLVRKRAEARVDTEQNIEQTA